jgi:hypothetical protein
MTKVAVIGAGIFGLCIAIELKKRNIDVVVFERNSDILQESSKTNQNRIHFGFHYPRSRETCVQCLESYDSFWKLFQDAIVDNFPNYYILDNKSKVSERAYDSLYKSLQLKYERCEKNKLQYLSSEHVQCVFKTNEPVFDYDRLKSIMYEYISAYGICVVYNTEINDKAQLEPYDHIVNATYVNINRIHTIFNIPRLKCRLQYVIIPIFEWEHDKVGYTIMDGPFCSILPNGAASNRFLLYHVTHSVINSIDGYYAPNSWERIDPKHIDDAIERIYDDSSKYFMFLRDVRRVSYHRAYRCIPINDDDSRVSEQYTYQSDGKHIITVLSGKITTSTNVCNSIADIVTARIFSP